jgi:hypothetical protein
LAILLCARASAAVVETAPAAAPSASVGAAGAAPLSAAASPIALVPGGASLIPSLSVTPVLSPAAVGAALGVPAAAGRVMIAPTAAPALPAAAAPTAAPAASAAPGAAADESVPPPAAETGGASSPSAAASTARSLALGGAEPAAASRALPLSAPALPALRRGTAEDAADSGRAFWDQASPSGRLAALEFSAARAPGAAFPARADRGGRPDAALDAGELRDAVSAGVPAAALLSRPWSETGGPGSLVPAPSTEPDGKGSAARLVAAGPSFPARIERLTLSLGSGLVVRVGSALGLDSATAARSGARAASAGPAPRRPAPLTSTLWLERRGLLETASLSDAPSARPDFGTGLDEAAAAAAVLPAANVRGAPASSGAFAARARRAGGALPFRSDSGSPLAWWALAFLPATLALLRDPLR